MSVRQWLKRDGNMVISETSIEYVISLFAKVCLFAYQICNFCNSHAERPPDDNNIRGQMNPGGYVLLNVPDQPHVTNVVWIFNADLKGWLPRYLVDQTLANLLMRHHECMREELQAYNPDTANDELYV